MSAEELLTLMREYQPDLEEDDAALLRLSYEYAEEKHRGQLRRSNRPYFEHPYEAAKILIEMRMDLPTVCAGLLHDVLEDTNVHVEHLTGYFGSEIASLVEGVTKLSALPFQVYEERQVENYRKMVIAMARDVRVVIVKLADRLHNMQTIHFLEAMKQQRIAKETLDIYAPLAARLGIHRIRTQLEDLSFKTLEPEKYSEIAAKVAEKRDERESYAVEMGEKIRQTLEEGGIKGSQVFGRPKHFYSIHQKITMRGIPFEEIHDLIAFRALVKEKNDCYLALGQLHSKWPPKHGRFKDYIATPKSNMYRSLHTTIMDRARSVEVQIRTYEMHRVCEFGIASHWLYKESGSMGGGALNGSIDQFAWFRQLLEQIRDVRNPSEFMQTIGEELFDDEIFVFTPNGDLKSFPSGVTPIDFAFAIHTEVGLTATGAKVNGRIVPLRSELRSGDVVEILTDQDARPSRDWLRFVKTGRARNKIKRWWREQEFERNVAIGRQLIETELHERKLASASLLTPKSLNRLTEELGAASPEALLADVGSRQISAQRIYHMLAPPGEPRPRKPTLPQMIDARLDGIAHTETRIAKCCAPVPGDDVVGYVTRGRGVTIHLRNCPRISSEFERVRPIQWRASGTESYPTNIIVESDDRKGLVRDVAEAIAAMGVNIHEGHVKTPDAFTAMHYWRIQVSDAQHLRAALDAIMRVKGVRRAARVRQNG